MRVLLLSAYHTESHRRWAEGLVAHLPTFSFELLTLPARHFSWRSRGSALSWAFDARVQRPRADLLLTTSMVDLASLRGMAPALSALPTLVYFHENQFAYPLQEGRPDAHLLITNLYTALAADRVLFNSPYNQASFLDGARELLAAMPDAVPDGVVEHVEKKSAVIPVGLEDELFQPPSASDGPLRILWNHRWEYDKAPERFFNALFELQETDDFRLVVVGQRFRQAPEIFAEARRRLADRIDHWGYVESAEEYRRWLQKSDLVVSTALHEFQGLAVQEAAALGCRPVLPDRLAYRDFFEPHFRYPSHEDDPRAECRALVDHLRRLLRDPAGRLASERPDLDHLRWSALAPRFEALMLSLN